MGLLQTPSARFADDGELIVGGSFVAPYNRYFLTVQALPWLEGTVSYTRTTSRKDLSGEDAQDKRFDAKIRLVEESRYVPAVAIGLRDFAGTGLFSSEYLVASKRYNSLDFSLGLGWGYLGSGGQFKNPLSSLSNSFSSRGLASAQGGTPETGSWFHGERMSVFGGVAYETSIPGLSLELELDGNDYQAEPYGDRFAVDSPINFGLTYRPSKWADIAVGVERGNTLMAQVVLHSNLQKDMGVPKFDPAPERLIPRSQVAVTRKDAGSVLISSLSKHGYLVDGVAVEDRVVAIHAEQKKFRSSPKAIGRIARIAANSIPPEIEEIRVVDVDRGIATSSVSLFRKDLENGVGYRGSPEEIWSHATVAAPSDEDYRAYQENPDRYPDYSWSVTPQLRQHMGGAVDTFYAYQIWARISANARLTKNLSLSGSLGLDIYNTFDQLNTSPTSKLPHVRSDIQKYLKEGGNGIENLELTYMWQPSPSWYARASAGLLEEMYGGVSGEVLYRPYGARWAVGGDIGWVKKRGFDKQFSFLDYEVITGHSSFYYDLPFYDLDAKLSVGRYLARDLGATFDLSRRFKNGTRLGVFATFTDVPAEEFGEGSFDKGIYVSIPIDLFFMKSKKSYGNLAWHPLTRDGGQMLNGNQRLHGLISDSTPRALADGWAQILD